MCLMGRGYEVEIGRPGKEEIYSEQDYWIFNVDSSESVEIVMADSCKDYIETAYRGWIKECDVLESKN